MKLAVVIPDRGDRPQFMEQCMNLLNKQTMPSQHIFQVNYPAKSEACDITARYKMGYEYASNLDFDLIAFMENDDWYHPAYLETMVGEWHRAGEPDMLGTSYTIYYHLKELRWFTMYHSSRSSAMSMLIRPGLSFDWGQDHDPYTDAHLWDVALKGRGVVFKPEHIICMGMKHGIGKCGGGSHTSRLERFVNTDSKRDFLRAIVDTESLKFYEGIEFKV